MNPAVVTSNPAISFLEDRYEAVSEALAAVRRGEPLTQAQREILREARVEGGLMPPRPSGFPWLPAGRGWRWVPGEKPGPLDGRAHP